MRLLKKMARGSRTSRHQKKRLLLMVGAGALGVALLVAAGLAIYVLVQAGKVQSGDAVFSGKSDYELEELIHDFDEVIHEDMPDDEETARLHREQMEFLMAAAERNRLLRLEVGAELEVEGEAGEIGVFDADGVTGDTPEDDARAAEHVTRYESYALPDIRYDSSVHNFLVIGVDSRVNDFSGRSDAIMIVSLNYRSGEINTLSLFRGAYVLIPGYGWSMLNHAYAWGGVYLLQQTIENNFRVKIDDYVVFNFGAFTSAIGALGGINITLTEAEAGALGLSAGPNRLSAYEALEYARLRYIDWDFNRMGRQRQVISAVISELAQADMGTINAAVGTVLSQTATTLGQGELASLTANLTSFLGYGRYEQQLPLAGTRTMFYQGGMEMWAFDFYDNINAMNVFLYGY